MDRVDRRLLLRLRLLHNKKEDTQRLFGFSEERERRRGEEKEEKRGVKKSSSSGEKKKKKLGRTTDGRTNACRSTAYYYGCGASINPAKRVKQS